MRKNIVKGLIVTGSALVLAVGLIPGSGLGTAWANQGTQADFIKTYDKDGDGKVSKDEFRGRAENFARMDKNQDGFIDQTEEPGGSPRARGRGPGGAGQKDSLRAFDKDGDNKLSKDEFPGPAEHFARFDKNGDGFLEKSELPQRQGRSGGNRPDPVRDFDRDGDNRLSQAEFPGPDDHFTCFDRNRDGYLDRDELPRHPPRLGGPGGQNRGSGGPGRGGPGGGPGEGGSGGDASSMADAGPGGPGGTDSDVNTVAPEGREGRGRGGQGGGQPEGDRPGGDRPDGDRPDGDRPGQGETEGDSPGEGEPGGGGPGAGGPGQGS